MIGIRHSQLFAQQLRYLDAPEGLFRLARIAQRDLSRSEDPGRSLVANLVLLALASKLDGEPVSESAWASVKAVLRHVADFIESPSLELLEFIAVAFREWQQGT